METLTSPEPRPPPLLSPPVPRAQSHRACWMRGGMLLLFCLKGRRAPPHTHKVQRDGHAEH